MIALNNFIEELQALLQVPAELGAEALDVAQVLRQRLAAVTLFAKKYQYSLSLAL